MVVEALTAQEKTARKGRRENPGTIVSPTCGRRVPHSRAQRNNYCCARRIPMERRLRLLPRSASGRTHLPFRLRRRTSAGCNEHLSFGTRSILFLGQRCTGSHRTQQQGALRGAGYASFPDRPGFPRVTQTHPAQHLGRSNQGQPAAGRHSQESDRRKAFGKPERRRINLRTPSRVIRLWPATALLQTPSCRRPSCECRRSSLRIPSLLL
jgi:hypothetical protein